jgi:hypothetical protein
MLLIGKVVLKQTAIILPNCYKLGTNDDFYLREKLRC